ncbi:MAG: hypothetical protein ACYTAS_13925 [Planctomycetota bacterium]|jgi:hypothetical protein
MWNVFEQPWTLLGVSVLALFGMLTFRSVWVEKRRWWQLLIPLALAGAAFGLDYLVATDLEKVRMAARSLLVAVENEDCEALSVLIAPDYKDSRHASKAALLRHCRQELKGPTVVVLKKKGDEVELSGSEATMTLSFFIRFEKESRIARQYKQIFLARVRLNLTKRPDGQWLIRKAELLEVDRFPMTWRSV